jgi:hypothetical protein
MKRQFYIEDFERLLLVEGYSDLRFYAELLEHVGKAGQVFIKDFSGREELASKLAAFLTPQLLSMKIAIGVVVDADEDARQAERALAGALSRATQQEVNAGKWTNGRPRVGLFVAPGQGQPGEIETLVWRAWAEERANTPQRDCIERFVACMSGAGAIPRSRDKGFVSALLAIRNDDDPRLGPGAQARIFDFNRPEYEALKQFLA